MSIARVVLTLALCGATAFAQAQGWSPSKNVEIIVGSAPGGSNDKTARAVERALVENKLVKTTISVLNKPGGGSSIAFTFVSQRPGDPHTLLVGTTALLTNHITGRSKIYHKDFTPIASLFNDYVVFVVNAQSDIKDGKDLVERLKTKPQSIAIGFATALGSHNHIAAGLLMKTIGGNVRDLKPVAYKGSSVAITNLLGGHIDLVTTAAGNAAGHVESGRLRVVGVAAPRRFGGALANVPTWKEQGVNLVYGGFRSIVGPKGLSADQVAFWENALRKASQTPKWQADLKKNYWSDDFLTGAEFAKELDETYAAMKSVLVDLGLSKQK
ncbi:MAG: tripartite tricarboxylate transporter substrate binding protein [Betaproteobacteria bacterium]|jgi:putative tricarboxylic transport membrane protein|nr:MAG: tripartite tricarboxylate transporter substrate binding protein [Betaproteobacteria bacterium]